MEAEAGVIAEPPPLQGPAGAAGDEVEEEWDDELAAEIAALDRAAEMEAEMEEREKLASLVRAESARESPAAE